MADQGTVTWYGASGKQYMYRIYPLPTGLKTGEHGNYIYAKVVNDTWVPIYIGQGDLGDRTNIDNHHQSRCLKSKKATHVHAHPNSRQEDRTAEERDLLASQPNAYQPTGCNEKPGA